MKSLTPSQQKALQTDRHIALTANAGSGKTLVLARRYVEIAVKENVSLRNIAAITFTDRAAGELYQKITQEVENLLKISTDPVVIRKLERITRELVSANISTIHSFCISILREYPMEAGIDAEFVPVDESASGELIDLSIEEVIRKTLDSEENETLKHVIRILGSKANFSAQMKELLRNYRNIILLKENLYAGTDEEAALHLQSYFSEVRDKILNNIREKIFSGIKEINDSVLFHYPASQSAKTVSSIIELINSDLSSDEFLLLIQKIQEVTCNKNKSVNKSTYFKKLAQERLDDTVDFIQDVYSDLDKFRKDENYLMTEMAGISFGRKLIYLLDKTFEIYERMKSEKGYLDYEDILLKTYNILKDELIRTTLSDKFRYIMVDEYQDTNELQYRIFLPIADWLGKGNLFVVGDEKQSIYMFRDADLAVFRKTKEDIRSKDGDDSLLMLPDSFRMRKELSLFTNLLFRNLFDNPEPLFNEVAPDDIICAGDSKETGSIEIMLSVEGDDKTDEGDLVANKILERIEKGEKFGEMAVLCRKRKSFKELEEILSKYNIPYLIVGGKEFYQRQLVYDYYNYFAFLLSRDDDTALTGILRSPFFFLSDPEIYNISLQTGITYWEKLKGAAASDQKIQKIYEQLNENLEIVHSLSFAKMLRKISRENGFLAVMAARNNGVQEVANIEKLVSLTIEFQSLGYKSLYDYVEYLRNSIAEMDDEPQAAVTESSDAVKVLTIHQAKGLEFNNVFLYKCSEYAQKNIVKKFSVIADKDFGILSKFPLNNNYFETYCSSPLSGIFHYIMERKNKAELKRLFYVAVTRAKNNLFISGECKENYSFNPDSFLRMLQEGLDINFSQDQFALTGSLKFLIQKNGSFENEEKEVSLLIPVTKSIEKRSNIQEIEQEFEPNEIFPQSLSYAESDEIISATKFSTYTLCPFKYYLLFELNLSTLLNRNEFDSYELRSGNPDHGFNKDAAGLRGRIIHKILEVSMPPDEVDSYITGVLKNEELLIAPAEYENFTAKIKSEIQNLYQSSTFNNIAAKGNSKQEYEVYLRENDYFLFGRMDKVIFNGNKICIIDYKTDNITQKEIGERGTKYLPQLRFYSYILGRIFPEVKHFTLTLIFTKHPELPHSINLSSSEASSTGKEIKMMMENVRAGKFEKNLRHCPACSFYINNKCIKESN